MHKATRKKVKFDASEEQVVPEFTASNDESWSSTQQKCLEEALVRFPKGTNERWENIADCVPNKTKV